MLALARLMAATPLAQETQTMSAGGKIRALLQLLWGHSYDELKIADAAYRRTLTQHTPFRLTQDVSPPRRQAKAFARPLYAEATARWQEQLEAYAPLRAINPRHRLRTIRAVATSSLIPAPSIPPRNLPLLMTMTAISLGTPAALKTFAVAADPAVNPGGRLLPAVAAMWLTRRSQAMLPSDLNDLRHLLHLPLADILYVDASLYETVKQQRTRLQHPVLREIFDRVRCQKDVAELPDAILNELRSHRRSCSKREVSGTSV
jgi:hypothetical protein